MHHGIDKRGFTRRRALALGAAAGVGGVLLRPGPSVAAGAPRTIGLALPAGAVPGGGRPGLVVRAPAPFDLLGLRGADLQGADLHVRVRRRGAPWSAWVPVGPGTDHAPDRAQAPPASDPVWAGGADELQLRAHRALRSGRLQLVTVPAAPPRARAAAVPRATTLRAAGAPPIVPREAWGAAAVPPRSGPSYGTVQLAFVHHTVSANAYRPEDSARIVLSIAKYHRDSNGWNDIGYNFLVDQYGQVFEGRAGGVDQAVVGAQAGGWNSQSTGIATIGDFEQVALPEAALQAVAQLTAWKLSLHGAAVSGTVTVPSGGGSENRYPYGRQVTLARVSGHRDGCRTACPGTVLYGQLDDLRARVQRIGPVAAATARATLTPVSTRVRFGDDAVLRGAVQRADGSAAADVPVSLQKRTSSGGWAKVGSARTAADGTYEARLAWKREAGVRAQAQLAPGSAGRVRSPTVTVALEPVVSVLAPGQQSRVQAGRSVSLRGSVGPSGPVRVVVERQESGGRWVAAGEHRASVTKTTFAAAVKLKKPALYRLTVVGGSRSAPVRATPIFVRAVRKATSVGGGQGGASASAAVPPATAGGFGAP